MEALRLRVACRCRWELSVLQKLRCHAEVLPGHFLQFITIGGKVDLIEFQTSPIGSRCHSRSPPPPSPFFE